MSRTVLVVDDEPTISEAVAARLRGEGYEVVTAADGPSAVDACSRIDPSGDIHLTRTEFDILAYLAARPRTAVSRETLLSELWGWDDSASSRTVDSHVKALRRKLGGDLIRTVHGVGYAVESPR